MNNSNENNLFLLWGFGKCNIIPTRYFRNLSLWQSNNTSYSLKILHKNECDVIAKFQKNSPYFKYNHVIQQCDYIRYILMYKYGGFYSDLDVCPNVNLNNLKKMYPEGKIFLVIETILDEKFKESTKNIAIRKGIAEDEVRVATYFFGSTCSKHNFWVYVMKRAMQRLHNEIKEDYDVIYTSGPDLLTTCYHEYMKVYEDKSIILLPKDISDGMIIHNANSMNKKSECSWRNEINEVVP